MKIKDLSTVSDLELAIGLAGFISDDSNASDGPAELLAEVARRQALAVHFANTSPKRNESAITLQTMRFAGHCFAKANRKKGGEEPN